MEASEREAVFCMQQNPTNIIGILLDRAFLITSQTRHAAHPLFTTPVTKKLGHSVNRK